jgi:hypothetical protein
MKERRGREKRSGKERKGEERNGELMMRKDVDRRKKEEIGKEIRWKRRRTEKCLVKDGLKCKERKERVGKEKE